MWKKRGVGIAALLVAAGFWPVIWKPLPRLSDIPAVTDTRNWHVQYKWITNRKLLFMEYSKKTNPPANQYRIYEHDTFTHRKTFKPEYTRLIAHAKKSFAPFWTISPGGNTFVHSMYLNKRRYISVTDAKKYRTN